MAGNTTAFTAFFALPMLHEQARAVASSASWRGSSKPRFCRLILAQGLASTSCRR
jgi:hypothetical protein